MCLDDLVGEPLRGFQTIPQRESGVNEIPVQLLDVQGLLVICDDEIMLCR